MSSVMHGIESDVRFNHAAARTLASRCRRAANAIDGQTGSRASWVEHGLTDFKGHYSELFRGNGHVQAADARLLVSRLREVADGADQLAREARSEQRRREEARAWKQRQDERGFWDHLADWFTGGEQPPVGPAAAPVTLSYAQAEQGVREPLSGSGSTGTSSARPANLRSFATNSAAANDDLRSWPGQLRDAYATFTAGCGWGTLEAATVWSGFDRYLTSNGEDVRWANTVAGAFEAAGGDGVVTTSNAAITASLASAGVTAERQQLSITPPQAYGAPPTTGYANDPVNTATGNFLEPECDLAFTGGSATLRFDRMYNSLNPDAGAFGPGWSSLAEAGLVLDADGARWRHADGRVVVFPRQGAAWGRATSEAYWLGAAGEGFVVTDNAGGRWEFCAAGKLVAFDRGPGTRVELDWEGVRLVGLAHERGRSVLVEWADDRIVALAAGDGRRVDYAYDQAGRLVAASTGGATRSYAWNAAGLIERVTDSDGVVEAANTYDEAGRVTEQVSRHGRVTRFSYLPGRVTVVADPDGERSNTWLHDDKGRLVGVVDAHDQRQSMAYDGHGQLVMATGRDGSVTLAEFDDRGRRTTQVLPSGARVDTTFDEADRPVEVVVDNDGDQAVTRYSYDGANRNPSRMVDAEGGVTRFVWDGNLLTSITDPTGVTVTHTYDAHGDLVATTDAEGHSARLERDGAGRVTAAVTPSGHRTTFAYDSRGVLASKTAPDGGVWAYEHTAGGRLSATIDPYGARTTIEHDESGEAHRTTDPLGRTVTRAFDDLGNLARVELPDGTAWRYSHDQLSRLVAITDPEGATWQREYDVNGTPTRLTDPGATSVVHTDRLGRIVSVQAPDGSNTLTRYDRCGRPVEYVDALGHVTTLERDAAGRLVALRRPDGAVTRYGWDGCGRLASVTDPLGGTTTFGYTPDAHLATETDATGAVTRYTYDALGRTTGRTAPGLGRSTWTFDLAGRVIGLRDRMWGQRTFRYDAAGQLVEAANAFGGVTRYTHDSLGRVVEVRDPSGGTVRRAWTHLGQLATETDPLGRTTQAGYDAAGRQVWQEQPTGERLAWAYDGRSGALTALTSDGTDLVRYEQAPDGRRLVATSGTGSASMTWDAAGRPVERSRDGRAVRWAWDANGRCVGMTTPSGRQTRYERDAAGRVTAIDTDGIGRVEFEHDASGRLVRATSADVNQVWEHRDGFVSAHVLTKGGASSTTTLLRDDEGRLIGVDRDGTTERYEHDAAGQLVAHVRPDGETRWTYDALGRVATRHDSSGEVRFSHDAGGQVTRSESAAGTTTYAYDAQGRRTQEDGPGGRTTFAWSARGWLSAVEGPHGRTTMLVDALGELARVNDVDLFWDSIDPLRPAVQVDDQDVQVGPGVLGGPGGWSPVGWRQRPTADVPWSSPHGVEAAGLDLLASGGVVVAGLEWLGQRAYDPATQVFLSVDPLAPIAATGWAHNPYSYAGNDPLHALDPSGRRPVTDAELQAYRDANQGFLADAGDWVANNWEYLAGGAMVIAGGALIATGVGGPAGMMLIGAGADTIIQKATTGEVKWDQVALSGALSVVGGVGATALAGRAGLTGLRATVAIGAGSGAFEGFSMGGYRYMTGPGPHSVGGFFAAAGTEGLAGGVLGGGGAAAGHVIQDAAGNILGRSFAADGTVLSGHGGIPGSPVRDIPDIGVPSNHMVVPEGVRIRMYGPEGDTILDSLGNQIERQMRWPFRPTPVDVYGPGDIIPEHYLYSPTGLNIVGNPTVVSTPTSLATLIQPNGGTYDWAACRNYPVLP
ncbi:MAG TPA: type IV secretion protein Rhs [Propionibacterium sp.]|nr:type IV secretion protein Rhs [Propionibacterium sp.]